MGDGPSVPRMPCQFSPMPVPCIRPLMEAGVLTRQGAVQIGRASCRERVF